MNYSAKEARETKIYFLETYNEVYKRSFYGQILEEGKLKSKWFSNEEDAKKECTKYRAMQPQLIDCDYRIATDNLFNFVMRSAEETTSPRGVEPKLHLRTDGRYITDFNEIYDNYEVWTWGFRGQFPKLIESFETEEEAENCIFDKTFEYDFSNDNNRDTRYYVDEEEAKVEILQTYADLWNVNVEVAKSILKKKEILENAKQQRELDRQREIEEKKKFNLERVNKLAEVYASMILPKQETFKETATRLGIAIGDKIESDVFFAAVRLIRKKYNKQ